MLERTSNEYLPEGAFVLQFAVSTDQFSGRVEHVVTGQAARFETAEELSGFVREVLRGERKERQPADSELNRQRQTD